MSQDKHLKQVCSVFVGGKKILIKDPWEGLTRRSKFTVSKKIVQKGFINKKYKVRCAFKSVISKCHWMRGLAFSNLLHIWFLQFMNLPKKIMIFIEVRWILNVKPTLKTCIHEKNQPPFYFSPLCFCFLFFPIFTCSFFFPVTKENTFLFLLQGTSCIAEMETQTVFSLISLSTESLKFSCLTISWETLLIFPNGSSNSQNLGIRNSLWAFRSLGGLWTNFQILPMVLSLFH